MCLEKKIYTMKLFNPLRYFCGIFISIAVEEIPMFIGAPTFVGQLQNSNG